MIRIPKYIRTDEIMDVLSTVEFMDGVVRQVEERPLYWKWLIKAAHSALQGALVCALSGIAGIGAFPKKLQGEWLEYFEKSRSDCGVKPPPEKLAPFKELLARARRPENMDYLGGTPLVLSEDEAEDLRYLNDLLRNNFVHFTPKGWSIEGVGLPRIVLSAIKATTWLMLEHPACRLKLNNDIQQAETLTRRPADNDVCLWHLPGSHDSLDVSAFGMVAEILDVGRYSGRIVVQGPYTLKSAAKLGANKTERHPSGAAKQVD